MRERLTWEEIKAKYPNQWVGLIDIEYLTPEDGTNIKSGVVISVSEDKLTVQKKVFSMNCGGTWSYTNPEALPVMFVANW